MNQISLNQKEKRNILIPKTLPQSNISLEMLEQQSNLSICESTDTIKRNFSSDLLDLKPPQSEPGLFSNITQHTTNYNSYRKLEVEFVKDHNPEEDSVPGNYRQFPLLIKHTNSLSDDDDCNLLSNLSSPVNPENIQEKHPHHWDEYEDFILIESLSRQLPVIHQGDLIKSFNISKPRFSWKQVSHEVPLRSEDQCKYRYNRLKNKNCQKLNKILKCIQDGKDGTFTNEEDIEMQILANKEIWRPNFRQETKKKENSMKYRYYIHHLKYLFLNGELQTIQEPMSEINEARTEQIFELYLDLEGERMTESQMLTKDTLLDQFRMQKSQLEEELRQIEAQLFLEAQMEI